jgi:hypothetical protein
VKFRGELEELEQKVKEERERYQEMLQHAQEEIASGGKPQIPQLDFSVTNFHVNDRFALNKELACYTLSLELVIPIEYVFLQV